MTQLDEFFAVLTEEKNGPLEIDGKRYAFASLAVRNPDTNSGNLQRLLELAHEHALQDSRPRILVRYRGKRHTAPMMGVELIGIVPIGPVEEVLRKI